MVFTQNEGSAPIAIEKNKILGAVLEPPAKQHCRFGQLGPILRYWHCCLAGSPKSAPRIFIFSIVLGAENLSYVKSIETHARAFLPLNILAVGSVNCLDFITCINYRIFSYNALS